MEECRSIAGKNITLMGYQDNAKVSELMVGARALVFAADEDFGIVPVEAQACGTPVIAFGRGGVVETTVKANGCNWGEATAVYFYEQTVDSLKIAIEQFLKWENNFRTDIIRKNSERFSRERFKNEIELFINDKFEDFKNKGR